MKFYFTLLLSFTSLVLSAQNNAILHHGTRLIYENKLDDAISYFNAQLAKSTQEKVEIGLLFGLADVYKLQLNYSKTYNYLQQAKAKIDLVNASDLEFLYHVKMMEFYRKRGLYADAIKNQQEAQRILHNTHIPDAYKAAYYGRRAAIFSQHFGQLDSVLVYANKALDLAKRANDLDTIFYASLEIANVYYRQNNLQEALIYFKQLLDFAQSNKLIQHQADVYINYTNALIKNKDLDEALQISLEALAFTTKHHLAYNSIIISTNIFETYQKLNNYKKAYEYLLLRSKLKEKYDFQEYDRFVLELEERHKLKEKENQIRINQLEIAQKNKALASSRTNFYIGMGMFLLAIFVICLTIYFLKKAKKSNKKLHKLSTENAFLLSEANHRINNNLQLVVILITDQLKKASTQNKFQLQSILTKVDAISMLHKHLYKHEDKKRVDACTYLNDVNSSFHEVFKEQKITMIFHADAVKIPIDFAMYFGLLFTELAINSVKHAFTNQTNKRILFELRYKEATLHFNYQDNGQNAINAAIAPKLIDKICRQLQIVYIIDTATGFMFSFKKNYKNEGVFTN
ncbi:sensor histidine kinase [Bizionia sediminis]|uniref:histidine kinase n=1 Tax=Bizionia sediminis TaxID=1737064 RepID=A0ABW5KUI0_9FLAO